MTFIVRWFRGIDLPPFLVRNWRLLLEGAGTAVIGFLVTELSTADWGQYAAAAPFVLAGLNWLEGVFDQIDPSKVSRGIGPSRRSRI